MSVVVITVIISFLLESIVSNFISLDSQLFMPLFTLVSLLIVYPFFNKKESDYLKLCAITGLFYDIVYTDTLLFHLLLFVMLGYLITKINNVVNTNFISICFMIPIIIILYRILSYSILCLSGFLLFDWANLGESIYSSLLLNIIYGEFIYIITDRVAKKHKVYKVD